MHVRSLDMLFAYKALSVEPNLTAIDRRVAAALLEHFNRRNGRCDPGLERIAELLAVNTRTVIRALKRLESVGFFQRIRHGGLMNRNLYIPKWPRFREIENAWSAKCKTRKMSPAPWQESQFPGDSPVTQTSRSNQSKGTSQGLPREEWGEGSVSLSPPPPPSLRPSLSSSAASAAAVLAARTSASPSTRDTRRMFSVSSAEAARQAALRRWTDALQSNFADKPLTYGQIIGLITPEMTEEATDAELKRRGGGLIHIAAKLQLGPVNSRANNDGAARARASTSHEHDGGEA